MFCCESGKIIFKLKLYFTASFLRWEFCFQSRNHATSLWTSRGCKSCIAPLLFCRLTITDSHAIIHRSISAAGKLMPSMNCMEAPSLNCCLNMEAVHVAHLQAWNYPLLNVTIPGMKKGLLYELIPQFHEIPTRLHIQKQKVHYPLGVNTWNKSWEFVSFSFTTAALTYFFILSDLTELKIAKSNLQFYFFNEYIIITIYIVRINGHIQQVPQATNGPKRFKATSLAACF